MTRRRNRGAKSVPADEPITIIKREPDKDGPAQPTSPSMMHGTPLPSAIHIQAAKSKSKSKAKQTAEARNVIKSELIRDGSEDADILEISVAVGSMRIREMSVMSVYEAQVAVDTFLGEETKVEFISKQENKLRLWQALCVEFRLVQAGPNPPPTSAGLAVIEEEPETETHSPNSDHLPPMPTSLTQAKNLLKSKAHVNIVDYLQARRLPVLPGQTRDMTHLLFPSASAMIRYTIKKRRFAKPSTVKDAFLEPLLKIMSHGRR